MARGPEVLARSVAFQPCRRCPSAPGQAGPSLRKAAAPRITASNSIAGTIGASSPAPLRGLQGREKTMPKLALAPKGLPGWPSAEGLSPCGFSSAPSRRSLLREASRKKERKEGDYFPAAEGAQKLFGGSGRTGVGAGLGGARCSLLPSFPSPPPLLLACRPFTAFPRLLASHRRSSPFFSPSTLGLFH